MSFEFMRGLLPYEVVVYIMIFFGSLLAFEGVRQLVSSQASEIRHKNRRMRMIAKNMDERKISEILLRNHTAGNNRAKGPIAKFTRALAHADIRLGLGILMAFLITLTVAIFLLASRFIPLPFAAVSALLLGFGLPYLIIGQMAEARMKKLSTQLPDALDLMARGLRVGHPINVTLRRVAQDMPDPIGTEFGIIEDRIRHSVDLVTAFGEFADRVDREDVHYLSVCIGIQHGTGGNLGRVLQVLSRVIRDKATMQKKIHAISSEGRLSGLILTMMPFLIAGTIYASTPSFFLDVKDHPVFLPVAITIVLMIVLQGLILNRLTNFDF